MEWILAQIPDCLWFSDIRASAFRRSHRVRFDDLEEHLPIARELGFADAGDAASSARDRDAGGHFGERLVVEDDVGRHVLRFGQFQAPGAQLLEQAVVAGGSASFASRRAAFRSFGASSRRAGSGAASHAGTGGLWERSTSRRGLPHPPRSVHARRAGGRSSAKRCGRAPCRCRKWRARRGPGARCARRARPEEQR